MYVLGNSSSLNQIDISGLTGQVSTVGVNRILRLTSKVRFVLIADQVVFEQETPRLVSTNATPLLWSGLTRTARNAPEAVLRKARYWDCWIPRAASPCRQPPSPDRFRFSSNTATYAVEAALLMGFRDIRLLGVDLRYDLKQSHFFGDGRKLGCHLYNLKSVLDSYRWLAHTVKKAGGTLVSESPYAGPLDDVLPRRRSPWLISAT